MAGKGSRPRPFAVPKDQYNKSFENIFGTYVPPYLRNRVEEQNKEQPKEEPKDKQ